MKPETYMPASDVLPSLCMDTTADAMRGPREKNRISIPPATT